MEIKMKAKGLADDINRVKAMAVRAADLTPVMKGRAEQFVGVIKRDVFGKQTSPFGKAWDALADSTVDGRRDGRTSKKQERRIKILDDTGRLKGLIHAAATRTGMTFGVGDIEGKANAHLFGTTKAGRNRNVTIPRRTFLPVDETGRTNFGGNGAAAKWLARATERINKWVEKGTL